MVATLDLCHTACYYLINSCIYGGHLGFMPHGMLLSYQKLHIWRPPWIYATWYVIILSIAAYMAAILDLCHMVCYYFINSCIYGGHLGFMASMITVR